MRKGFRDMMSTLAALGLFLTVFTGCPMDDDTSWSAVPPVKIVSAGSLHTAIIGVDGSLWAWGRNAEGQLGIGETGGRRESPVRIGSDNDWVYVSAGGPRTFAIREDGSLWAWGSGRIGDGMTGIRNIPTRIGPAINWATVSASSTHTVAIGKDGSLWTWGGNSSGQLGDGTRTHRDTPVRIGAATNWASASAGHRSSTGNSHTIAIREDGSLWAWGANGASQLGDGTRTSRNTPVRIGTATNWAAASTGISLTMAVREDGSLWAWGADNRGDGMPGVHGFPTPIEPGMTWSTVSAGYRHNLAIRMDGTLWAWGDNRWGQLGIGETRGSQTPTRIGTATNWASVSAGENYSVAIREDGSLWAWGRKMAEHGGRRTSIQDFGNTPVRMGGQR